MAMNQGNIVVKMVVPGRAFQGLEAVTKPLELFEFYGVRYSADGDSIC